MTRGDREDPLVPDLTNGASVSPDVYFTAGYGRAAAYAEHGAWSSIVLADGQWQMPLLVRTLPTGRSDAISPYGYAGVYQGAGVTDLEAAELWAVTRDRLRRSGIISVFVRESPIVPQASPPRDAISVVRGHSAYYVPCLGENQNWDAMEGRSRTSIRKAERLGMKVELRTAVPEDLEPASPFRRLYEGTMGKVDAGDYYYFTDEYYAALLDGLADNLLLGLATDQQGDVQAASLFLRGPSTLHYHLSGSTREGARGGATNAVLWAAIKHANAADLAGVLLGGGVRDGDGLERFKRSFGGQARTFNAYGLVLDQDGYDAEIALTAERLGVAAESFNTAGFFPAYRRVEAE